MPPLLCVTPPTPSFYNVSTPAMRVPIRVCQESFFAPKRSIALMKEATSLAENAFSKKIRLSCWSSHDFGDAAVPMATDSAYKTAQFRLFFLHQNRLIWGPPGFQDYRPKSRVEPGDHIVPTVTIVAWLVPCYYILFWKI